MKYKTFYTTLFLFLVTLYCGVMVISVVTFKDTVEREKEKSLDKHYLLISGLVKDMEALSERGIEIENNMGALILPYQNIVRSRTESLVILTEETIIYVSGTLPERINGVDTLDSSQRVSAVIREGDRKLSYVEGKFPQPYETYGLVYSMDITEVIAEWAYMRNFLFMAAAVLSLIFAFFNSLILNRIFQPLIAIGNTSEEIAAGDYDLRLPESSGSELQQVAKSFNAMMDEMQRHMKELTDAANQKQQFVDNFSHELNTPLTAIYGYAQYLQSSNYSQEKKFKALEFITNECSRLQNLASQLLELANLNNSSFSFRQCNLEDIFDKTQQMLMSKLYAKEIILDIECNTPFLYGNGDLLLSLLINLVDNAIKACDTGGCIFLTSNQENRNITITVEDNGKGMEAGELLNITKPFYRSNRARSRKDGGNGIGLSICSQIVDLHNGKLEFYSRPAEGTKVVLTFTSS